MTAPCRPVPVLAIAGLIGLGACGPTFESVDDACPDAVEGEDLLEADRVDTVRRWVCYRRFLGLPDGRVTRAVQASAAQHAAYLAARPLGEEDGTRARRLRQDDADAEDFVGTTPADRLEASGASSGTRNERLGSWGIVVDRGPDAMIAIPWAREPLLQPRWNGLGLAPLDPPDGSFEAYAEVLAPVPAGRFGARPIVYPRDGQGDVPTDYDPSVGLPFDPLDDRDLRGFPITITFDAGDDQVGLNPLGIALTDVVLEGPDGPVPATVLVPGDGGGLSQHRTTAIVSADAPLQPDARYELRAQATWLAGEEALRVRFVTAP